MTPVYIIMGVFLALFLILAMWAMGVFNNLVKLRNRFENAFSQIDVQLKRRHDLIPNLVETVKTYMTHERETLEAVINARNAATSAREGASPGDAASMSNLAEAENGLGGVLGRLFALSENYPDLRSNQNMLQLQEELTSTESKVAFSRQSYNDAVMHFNNKLEMFPSNFIANMFNFVPATMFEVADESERESVKVKF